MEPRQNRAGGSEGGKPDFVTVPKSLGILIFQRLFPRCGRRPARIPRYKNAPAFPGTGKRPPEPSLDFGGLGEWRKIIRIFFPRGFFPDEGWDAAAPKLLQSRKSWNIRGPSRWIFVAQGGGWWFFIHRVGKEAMTIPKFQRRDGKGAWFEKYFEKENPKPGMRAYSQLEFCSQQLPPAEFGGEKSEIEGGAKNELESLGGQGKGIGIWLQNFHSGGSGAQKFQLDVWLQKKKKNPG